MSLESVESGPCCLGRKKYIFPSHSVLIAGLVEFRDCFQYLMQERLCQRFEVGDRRDSTVVVLVCQTLENTDCKVSSETYSSGLQPGTLSVWFLVSRV